MSGILSGLEEVIHGIDPSGDHVEIENREKETMLPKTSKTECQFILSIVMIKMKLFVIFMLHFHVKSCFCL